MVSIKNPLNNSYKNLNLIKVSRSALIHNYKFFQKLQARAKICPVLKSNAYGHGLNLIAQFVDKEIKPPFIIVDSLYEAYELEKKKVKTPILIMGYTFPENFKISKKLKFTFPVYDEESAAVLSRYQPNAKVHIKIDTGMNRLGIPPNQARSFAKILKKYPRLKIEGIYSHLSQADDLKRKSFTKKQVKIFKEVIRIFEKEGFKFCWKHISATAGARQIFDPEFNLIRLGLGFYGISPFPSRTKFGKGLQKSLKPALRLLSHLVQIKTIEPGSQISYGGTFVAHKKMKIGILPLGYYDGLDRRLSNKGVVRIGDKFCPILGRVCMNLTIIDLSKLKRPRVGQRVIVYDNRKESPNNLASCAKTSQTIPYVLLVNLSETTKRVLR